MLSRPGVFQLSIFWVLLWVNWCVFPPCDLLRVFATLFPCCLSIRLFCYDLSVPIFCSKIILLPSHLVVGISSPILPLLARIIFFHRFGISCFICIVWSCLGIFLGFLLSPVSSDLSFQVVSFDLIVLLFSLRPNKSSYIFFFVSIFTCCRRYLICVSNLKFPSRFWLSVRLLQRNSDFFTD